MPSSQILLFSVLLLISLSKTYGKRDFLIVFDTCSMTCNTSYVDVCYCHVNKTFNPPRGTLYYRVIRQADKFKFSFDVSLLKKNNESYNLINSTNNDGCAFLEGNNIPTLMKIYRDILKEFGNLPKRCPIAKGLEFTLKDCLLDPERFPPYVPESRFFLKVTYYIKDEHILTVVGYADVVQTGSKSWLRKRGRL